MLNPDIQLFAEPADPVQAEPKSDTAETAAAPKEGGKVFSEDYVHTVRSEAAGYRTAAKAYEAALRQVLGLKDGDELGDLNARVSAYQQSLSQQREAALQTANQRLIRAELLSLDGYNHKLLEKVIDWSSIQVDDKGNVTGVKEAAEAAEKEFPEIKAAQRQQYAPVNPAEPPLPEMTKEAFLQLPYAKKYEIKTKHPDLFQKIIGGK